MSFAIYALAPELWLAFEELFGERRPASRFRCIYCRIGSDYHKRTCEVNKAAFCELVKSGPPPSLLALVGDFAVGWCQLTARDVSPWLDRTWRLKRVDDMPVWSVPCFYIRKDHRRHGVSFSIITATLEDAKQAGAPALEADPLDANLTPSSSHTGYISTFKRAGFKIIVRHIPSRPIMRNDFHKSDEGSSLPKPNTHLI